MATNKYRTTESAGWFVAGKRIPQINDGDGNPTPQVGFVLDLTDAEAKYPLLNGEIVALDESGRDKPARAPRDAASNG